MDSTAFHSLTPAPEAQTAPLAVWRAGFLASMRETGNASAAARHVGIDRTTAYKAAERDPSFAADWAEAIVEAGEALEMEARRRAMGEYISYKFDKSGNPLIHPLTGEPYAERAVSDALLTLLLKAAFPDRYKDRSVVETPPPPQQYDLSLLSPEQLNLLESITRAATPAQP